MAFTIDTTTYDKHAKYPQLDANGDGRGYGSREGVIPSSIVIHTTNGNKGSSFSAEANYLRDSPDVSAHFLVGRSGQIAQILHPAWEAWHAGKAVAAYQNLYSIGIENHHAVGEAWTAEQHAALTWLVEQLMLEYAIPNTKIDTHRYVAIPGPTTTPDSAQWRKSDPNDWSDQDFYAWRGQLATVHTWPRYTVRAPCAVLTDRRPDAPLAGGNEQGQTQLMPGDVINVGDVTNGWLWVSPDEQSAPGIGFIPSSYAQRS